MYLPRKESYFLVELLSSWKGEGMTDVVTQTAQSCDLLKLRRGKVSMEIDVIRDATKQVSSFVTQKLTSSCQTSYS